MSRRRHRRGHRTGRTSTAGVTPQRDITVMGIRAEDAAPGSSGITADTWEAARVLGLLCRARWNRRSTSTPDERSRSVWTRRDSTLLLPREQPALSGARQRKGYFELHIEQGPVLHCKGFPVGIVTGIRGCLRARSARTTGFYTHSGAVPQEMRQDAVLGTAELVLDLERQCDSARANGPRHGLHSRQNFSPIPIIIPLSRFPAPSTSPLISAVKTGRFWKRCRTMSRDAPAEIGERRGIEIGLNEMSLVTHRP